MQDCSPADCAKPSILGFVIYYAKSSLILMGWAAKWIEISNRNGNLIEWTFGSSTFRKHPCLPKLRTVTEPQLIVPYINICVFHPPPPPPPPPPESAFRDPQPIKEKIAHRINHVLFTLCQTRSPSIHQTTWKCDKIPMNVTNCVLSSWK